MGTGTPVIMTDSLENAHYPADVCLRISSGLSEPDELEAVVDWSVSHPASLREIGMRAQAYVRQAHNIEQIAERFRQVLEDVCN
jgi:hypothetical protein